MIHPSPNFNGGIVEVWEWISNCIQRFTVHVIHAGLNVIHVSIRDPCHRGSGYQGACIGNPKCNIIQINQSRTLIWIHETEL